MNNDKISRKAFIKQIYKTVTKNISGLAKQKKQYPLRPPGAVEEILFIKLCNSCGECIKACSHNSIKWLNEFNIETKKLPAIIPAEQPCYLCDDPVCSQVCKQRALKPVTRESVQIRIAKINKNRCLSIDKIDRNCDYCYDRCPLKDKAIYYNKGPEIRDSYCTGCGICEYYCVTDPKSIIITKPKLVTELEQTIG